MTLCAGDIELYAPLPAPPARDLHQSPGRGLRRYGELQDLHLPRVQVHGGDGLPESPGESPHYNYLRQASE